MFKEYPIKPDENTQSKCLKMYEEVNHITVEVEKLKKNMNKLINNFNTIEKIRGSFIVLNDVYT